MHRFELYEHGTIRTDGRTDTQIDVHTPVSLNAVSLFNMLADIDG